MSTIEEDDDVSSADTYDLFVAITATAFNRLLSYQFIQYTFPRYKQPQQEHQPRRHPQATTILRI
jgi:hypothetical protein